MIGGGWLLVAQYGFNRTLPPSVENTMARMILETH